MLNRIKRPKTTAMGMMIVTDNAPAVASPPLPDSLVEAEAPNVILVVVEVELDCCLRTG